MMKLLLCLILFCFSLIGFLTTVDIIDEMTRPVIQRQPVIQLFPELSDVHPRVKNIPPMDAQGEEATCQTDGVLTLCWVTPMPEDLSRI